MLVIGVGQLYVHGWRLPSSGWFGPLGESINQIFIFSPLLVLLAWRRQSLRTAWVRTDRLLARIVVGLSLALAAIVVFTSLQSEARSWFAVVPRVYRFENLPHAVQVLLEDIAIAILVVRLSAATGRRTAVLITAALFAAGHIPAMIATGADAAELVGLVRDFLLGIAVIGTAQRSADVAWLWCVHFAMDMMQFESGATLR